MAKQTPIHVSRERVLKTAIDLTTSPATLETLNKTIINRKVNQSFTLSFCPKCGSLLEPAHGKAAEIYCRKCKYRTKLEDKQVLARKIDTSISHREIAVVDSKDSQLRTYTVVQAICSVCNNNTSETWTLTIGSEGTSGVTFLRCTNCGHTRREAE